MSDLSVERKQSKNSSRFLELVGKQYTHWKICHPHPPKGKWLVYEVANTEEEQPIAWECSECGAVVDCKTKFCPECGQEKEV